MQKIYSLLLLACVFASTPLVRAAETVTISEFLASNTSGLRDEDNTFGDWIELYNSGTTNVNLDGWFLTDSAGNPTKWRIPNTNILAGSFLVIFADGKNRSVPGATLHTSFNLSAGGEFLALVKPDGVTVASLFSPAYPGQVPDVSYGFVSLTTNFTAVSTNAAVRVRIPNGSEGNWLTNGYDDSAWTAGTNGVGFGSFLQADYSLAVLPTAPLGYWRLNETSGTTAANIGSGGGLNGTYTAATLGTAGPRPPAFNGFEGNNNAPTFNGSSAFVAGSSGLLSGRNAFTVGGWINPQAAPAARTGLFGQNDCVEFGFISATTLELWTPGGGSLTAVPYPFPLNQWHHVIGVADGSTIRIFIDGVQAGSGGAPTGSYGTSAFGFNIGGGGVQDAAGNFFNGLIDEVVVYHRALSPAEILGLYQAGTNASGGSSSALIRTDVSTVMSNLSASAYVRIPFTIANPTNAAQVSLRMRYNDGFVAYLNGIEVVRVNAPETLDYQAQSTGVHSSIAVETFLLGSAVLVAGSNVLAIHGLNASSSDTNFLIAAEVVITSVEVASSTPLYFSPPSPGALNLGGVANPGPSILNASHTPNVPLDAEDIVLTARLQPTFYAVSNLVARYRIMFGPEIELQMFDDGAHGDGAAADGVYGVTIPAASGSTNGQMIRWFFRSTDVNGNTSRFPIFASAVNSAEYLGTIVDPTNVTSKLPIFHLFAAPAVLQTPRVTPVTTQTGADGEGGGRIAIFYDGEFYDNVYMELRGNTSAGQNKKSHRLEFNREHLFRHLPGFPRIRKTSFMAEFLDPAYLRQHLSFWMLEQMGMPTPLFYPVRTQLNGQFYGLVFHNDVIGQEQVERMGYDPKGALYKAAGNVLLSRSSTGVFQKLEPDGPPDYTDYNQLVNGIVETAAVTNRRAAAFDMLDIPEVINYLAGARWNAENDDVWANMSLHRDTYGDQLWRVIPFDMNASWGQRYGGITPLDAIADTCKSHPLYGGSTIIACDGGTYNRIYDVIIALPETRQMLLRRQRTILDRWVLEPGVAPESRLLETHIRYMTNLIWNEAFLDRAGWGYSTWTASNKPLTNAVDELFTQFINLRRNHWNATHSITNAAKPIGITPTSNAGIPLTQPTDVTLEVVALEFNPPSASQAQEFICLSNPAPLAVDISGWKLDGAVNFTFKPGTVVPSNSVLYLSPDLAGFRSRTTGPRSGQGLFVIAPYKGSLDARGETIVILNAAGQTNNSFTYVGAPSLPQQYLRITELMYHPGPTNVGSPYAQEEFEYLELKNIGPVNLNLVGIHFTNGVEFAFRTNSALTNLAPGQIVLLVKNAAAFTLRHGGSATIAGVYSNSLDNSGERIKLDDALGEQIMDFTYNNSWYPITDGLGFSLVIIDENAPFETWDLKASWRPSAAYYGSAGTNDGVPVVSAPIVVNEVFAHSVFPAVDFIELHNPTTNAVDVGDWWISDDYFQPRKYRIPAPNVIPVGGFLTIYESDFNTGLNAFGFSSAGDEAYVFAGDTNGNITGYFEGFNLDPTEQGVSIGRYFMSTGDLRHVAQTALTPNGTNAGPKVGPILISEIMYHPPDLAGLDNSLDEFVELQNISGTNVPLFDPTYPTNRWKLDDAVHFSFSTNTSIPAGGLLVVVSFDPTNTVLLSGFRAIYGIGTNVAIVGPYTGQLDNSDDRVELKTPDTSVPTNITTILVERVHYGDQAPWDPLADGIGPALQRIVAGDYGDDGTNWVAVAPNPGAAFTGGAAPQITVQPAPGLAVSGRGTNTFSVVVTGVDLRYQWRLNGTNVPGATADSLVLINPGFALAGNYSVLVMNGAGLVFSSNALLTVVAPVTFTISPTNQITVESGTNVNVVSLAVGTGTVRYQWQFEGTNLPNATNATYSFTNASLAFGHGLFRVIVTDDLSTATSTNAQVFVRIRPGIILQPLAQQVVQGQNALFICQATGAPPIFYRWLTNGVGYLTNTSGIFIFPNAQTAFTVRANVVNAAGNVNSSSVAMTVLRDFDGDGMADIWETNYFGFSTNNTADGLLDFDGDGMSNRDEFIAGTNPTNALSLLKLIQTATNANVLQFTAQTNRTYSILCRTNLGDALWGNVTNIFPSTAVRTVLVNSAVSPPLDPERYYRVITPFIP